MCVPGCYPLRQNVTGSRVLVVARNESLFFFFLNNDNNNKNFHLYSAFQKEPEVTLQGKVNNKTKQKGT